MRWFWVSAASLGLIIGMVLIWQLARLDEHLDIIRFNSNAIVSELRFGSS